MALTGQAKTDYQREYMRKRRKAVRPPPKLVRPDGISENQWAYMQYKAGGRCKPVGL